MESRPIDALIEFLNQQERLWIRLAAIRPDDTWQLTVLDVTTTEAPPSWGRNRWLYERAVFIASRPRGRTVARWLERGRIVSPPLSLPITVHGPVTVDRRQSGFAGIYEPLPWPTQEWTLHFHDSSGQTVHDELVAAGAPAFIGFDQAASAFFGVPAKPNRNFSGREIVVREQDRRARIARVRVHPTYVSVEVQGERRHGTSLTLSGAAGASARLSARTREVRLAMPDGLGEGAWLALHHDGELLDRRILDVAWSGGADDVEVVVDTDTRVELLTSGGESATVEFKRELPEKDPTGFLRTVAAFANGAGGTILFGVADDGEIVGIGKKRLRRDLDRLTSLVTDRVRPLPQFASESVDIAGRVVVALNVGAGDEVPYGVGTSDRAVRFYIRRGANTFPASSADVRALVLTRMPLETPSPRPPRPRFRRR